MNSFPDRCTIDDRDAGESGVGGRRGVGLGLVPQPGALWPTPQEQPPAEAPELPAGTVPGPMGVPPRSRRRTRPQQQLSLYPSGEDLPLWTGAPDEVPI